MQLIVVTQFTNLYLHSFSTEAYLTFTHRYGRKIPGISVGIARVQIWIVERNCIVGNKIAWWRFDWWVL